MFTIRGEQVKLGFRVEVLPRRTSVPLLLRLETGLKRLALRTFVSRKERWQGNEDLRVGGWVVRN